MTDTGLPEDLRSWPEEATGEAGGAEAFADVDLDDDGMPSEESLRQALKAVIDPEIGINIVDLGLLYGVDKADGKVTVTMTLTSMGCPLTELMHQQCTLILTHLPGVDDVDVDFTFSPPWSTDMIAEDAKEELRAMGFNV
ncbi:MAG: metal-sulfur cluster assembly factor [Actinomycetota bacterium]|nr:metal-sulfur cluster assembly factor [Actinomycetota bacterium]